MASISSSVKALNSYLKHSKTTFLKYHASISGANPSVSRVLHIIMGNEALDLDSAVSSILLANLYHHYIIDSQDYTSDNKIVVDVVPLLPIDRRDFNLRTEAALLFSKLGINLENLLFLDDLNSQNSSIKDIMLKEQASNSLRLTLTDHNVLSQEFKELSKSVVGIVDHHEDQSIESHAVLTQEKQIIVPLGSATTLVGERYLGISPLPSLESTTTNTFEPTSLITPVVVNLMIGTILIDTVNCQPSFGRITPRDSAVIDRLVQFSISSKDSFGLFTLEQRTAMFEMLQAAKFDLSSLSSAELLRKDYKAWLAGKIKYGISSVTISTSEWLEKDAKIQKTMSEYMQEQKLSFLLVMTSFTDPKDKNFKRELIALSDEANDDLFNFVISTISEPMTLVPSSMQVEEASRLHFFNQTNIKLSRKQMQPSVNDAIVSWNSKL